MYRKIPTFKIEKCSFQDGTPGFKIIFVIDTINNRGVISIPYTEHALRKIDQYSNKHEIEILLERRDTGISVRKHKKGYIYSANNIDDIYFLDNRCNINESINDRNDGAERRIIPSHVKIYVWRRDKGKCVMCGSNANLEYDHIIPVSKGGSNTERNIQLLCEKCNRSKGAKIV